MAADKALALVAQLTGSRELREALQPPPQRVVRPFADDATEESVAPFTARVAAAEAAVRELYGGEPDAARLATQWREVARGAAQAGSLGYGEMDAASLCALVSRCAPRLDGSFVDLGSGRGQAVLLCALVFDFKRALGIEIVPSLHRLAAAAALQRGTASGCQVQFVEGDAAARDDWAKEASVVFANSSLFDEALRDALERRAESLRRGAFLIVTTHALRNARGLFALVAEFDRVSWYRCHVFIYRRA